MEAPRSHTAYRASGHLVRSKGADWLDTIAILLVGAEAPEQRDVYALSPLSRGIFDVLDKFDLGIAHAPHRINVTPKHPRGRGLLSVSG